MRILIADDDEISLDVLRFSLEKAGHHVDAVRDGAAALRVLSGGDHRLIISDWEMPGMSGVDLCKQVRARDFGGYTYFVLLTSRDSSASTVEGLVAGADDFMTKPFNPDELWARVRVAERIVAMEMRDVTIFALAKLAESRDPETGHHLERVQTYSRMLPEQLRIGGHYAQELDAGFVKLIYETSPLHDIGKVAIPDCVLLKPGRLSDEEFAVMKTHTTVGAQTLAAATVKYPKAKYLQMARQIAQSHHERWDGNGYPDGLRGLDIPLAARIVALADVYDALMSKRVYKGAFTHLTARSIIMEGRGSHFDPVIVEGFLSIEAKFLEVQTHFSEVAEAA